MITKQGINKKIIVPIFHKKSEKYSKGLHKVCRKSGILYGVTI